MTSRTISLALNRRRANCRRALGYLLLLLIAYGATVEAAHGHGRVSPDRPGAAAIRDAGGSHSSQTRHSHDGQCVTCQFQQQLFNGHVHAPLFTPTPSAQIASATVPTVVYSSTSTTRPSGRAPPLVCA